MGHQQGLQRLPTNPRNVRQGLPSEILEDRACAEAIDAAFEIHRALGSAHTKETYLSALALELRLKKRQVATHASFSVLYRKQVVGSFVADLVLDGRVLIQVVSGNPTIDESYLEPIRGLASGGLNVGLVFHFGAAELSFSRIL
tara:strand:- start:470 stop:901 length:432 start_codon:yes stop_codon:yes gene_type:complete